MLTDAYHFIVDFLLRRRPRVRPLPKSVKHFYRYSAAGSERLEWLKPLILDHHIYAPTAKQLNDLQEARPLFARISDRRLGDFFKRMYRENNPGASAADYTRMAAETDWMIAHAGPELRQRTIAYFYSLTENTRVFSMSGRWNNMALWAKYADNHRGYCLEFRRQGLFTAAQGVIYSNRYRFDLANPFHATSDWFFCKSSEWTNEEEIRLVLARAMGGPYFRIEPQWLSRVILGKEMPSKEREQIRAWAMLRRPMLEVVTTEYEVATQTLKLVPIS